MNFFWSEEEALNWLKFSGMSEDEDIYCLTLEEAVKEAYFTFKV